MRLAVGTGVAVLVAAFLPAAAGSVGASRVSLCRASQLDLKLGPDVSAATGQNPFAVRLTNRGQVACVLDGYPVVSFSDRRGPVPFVVRDGGGHGGDQQVTLSSPRRLLIRPGGAAYVILNKYRCDLGSSRVATRMQLALRVGPAVRRLSQSPLARRGIFLLQACLDLQRGERVAVRGERRCRTQALLRPPTCARVGCP